ncbi:MAG: class I SAM-dependent RNA methyltransferase [Actinobacteria bacterium]|nr:class I SAM-dependent RNA methyltransferase [Actinomycetota bacterium]
MTELERVLEVVPERVVAGGDALARDPEGRVVMVPGVLSGERVRVEITTSKKSFARARLVEVLDASPERVSPPCPYVASGCGGCDWQHVSPGAQRRLRREVVVDALTRIGKVSDAEALVSEPVALATEGYRTTVRVLVEKGRPAFRRAHSHDAVRVDACLVAHPLLDALLRHASFDGVTEVELRCGAHTGERLVLAHPTTRYLDLPDDVVRIGSDQLERGATASYTEQAAGRRWRISARSFFQAHAEGAQVLAELVRAAVPDRAKSVVDLYAGVGLFAGTLARAGRRVHAIEGNPTAVRDARHNLRGLDVTVTRGDVARWEPEPADVVIADPARTGLGAEVTERITGTGAGRVVLISCDAAALGRDLGLFAGHGYRPRSVTPVDLFPHTSHVEVVTVLDRST